MRRLSFILFLFTLSSSHRLHRRSEDVDPLLKELFSEVKTPPPKDRRDGQTSGDFDPGSGSNKAQSENMNDTAPSGPQGEGEAGSGDTSDKNQKDFGNGSNNNNAPSLPSNNSLHDNNAPLLPSNNSPPDIKAQRLSANSSSPQKELDAQAVAKNDDKPGSGASGDDAEGIKQDSGSGGDSELFSSGFDANVPEKTSSAGDPDEKSVKPSSQESAEETKTGNVAAEKDAAIASPGFASVSEQGVSAEVKNPDNQPVYTSDSAKANVNTAVTTSDLPAEKQEASVSTGQGEDITTDTSQSRNSQDFSERARGNIPDTPANTDLLTSTGNDAQQPSNSENLRSSIPEAPAGATQPAWSAVNRFPALSQINSPETNEKEELVKKTSIPVAPHQPGASSYPLQLNKHSPGAELIKRFFIAKKEAQKKKEEDAKQKSLIGDGRYFVSSNNGYYNYAAAPQVPPPNLTGLKENGKQGICVDKYDSCPEFAKNHYCTDYKTLMKVQCQKSCKFCDDDDEDEEDSEESDKPENGRKDDEGKGDDDDDDEDDDSKTDDKGDKKLRKKNDKIAKEDNDDDDDGSDIKQASSGSGEQFTDSSGSYETEADSSSGSGSENREQFQDISPKSSDSGSGSGEDLPPTAEEIEDDESEENGSGSGSGKREDSDDDDSDELAKDLAEQELFTQDVKKDTIPNPSAPAAPAPYPKINLKDIARYVSLYRSVAKKLFGEALDSAKKEFVAQQSKKSDIPIPIKDELKSESKPSSSSLEGFYSSQEQKKRDDIPMNPNNAVYTPSDESWANRAYKEAESYLRSKIPEFKNYAPPAMFNYPFYINDPNKTVEETNEGASSKKSEIPENPEEKYNKTLQEILRRDHVNKPSTDPYEYLRNMIPGSSMKPIASKNGITYVPDSFSRPIHLRTKSQWFDLVAKKKSSIPKVPQSAPARSNVGKPAPSVPQIQTKPEALAAQVTQYKSTVPQAQEALAFRSTNPSPETSDSSQSQSSVSRTEVPQPLPQMQQDPSAQNADLLQSNEATEQATNPDSSFGEVDARSKAVNQTEAASPSVRVDHHTHQKDSSH